LISCNDNFFRPRVRDVNLEEFSFASMLPEKTIKYES